MFAAAIFLVMPGVTAAGDALPEVYDYAGQVLVDGCGNVYVAGVVFCPGHPVAVVRKYGPTGEPKGSVGFPVPEDEEYPSTGGIAGLARDNDGTVCVSASARYTTAKFDRRGTLLWIADLGGLPGHANAAAMDVDAEGHVYVAGRHVPPGGERGGMLLARFDGDATPSWQKSYYFVSRTAFVGGVAAVPTGGAVVTARGYDPVTGEEGDAWATWRYDADGARAWVDWIAVGGGNDIAVDGEGNVFAAGDADVVEGNDSAGRFATLVKYRVDGEREWIERASGRSFRGILLRGGLVFTVGEGKDYGYHVAAWTKSGDLRWERRFTRAEDPYLQMAAFDVAADGSVVVTGEAYLAGGKRSKAVTVRYDLDGDEKWASIVNAPDAGMIWASDVAIDGDGDAIVVGDVEYADGDVDAVVIQYDPHGHVLWSETRDGAAFCGSDAPEGWSDDDPCPNEEVPDDAFLDDAPSETDRDSCSCGG